MVFVACGLNHKTASLDLREKFALFSADHHALLAQLAALDDVSEVVVLSTCNRTEIYGIATSPAAFMECLALNANCCPDELIDSMYCYQEDAAVHHLLRVASGLDSMMLGEPQILGQLKNAYQAACQARTIHNTLHTVFQFIFSATKRVRTQSGVGKNPISIAYAAVQLITQVFKSISSATIFMIGSGETAALVAKYLYQKGARQFMIANRTQETAQRLATQFDAQALSITDIPYYLPKADIVISATSCPLPFINVHLVERALLDRENAPLFLLDLAMPRDIEPDVATLDGVTLYNLDDLQVIVGEGQEERRSAAQIAEQLIDAELAEFISGQRAVKANDVIIDYRRQMKDLAATEVRRAQRQLSLGVSHDDVLLELSERLVNKLTHFPTVGLRQAAVDDRSELLDLAQYLFNKNQEVTTL